MTACVADGSPAIAHLVNTGDVQWQPGDLAEAWFRPEDAWPIPAGDEPGAAVGPLPPPAAASLEPRAQESTA